jgi:hypothetical protein
MNRLVPTVATLFFLLSGCADQKVRGIDELPKHPARYVTLYFSSSVTPSVVVSSVMEESGTAQPRGMAVQNGGVMPEPLWLWPGWVEVTYACSSDYQSYYTIRLWLAGRGAYYLYCDSTQKLSARRLKHYLMGRR